jgi:hypothetical protein
MGDMLVLEQQADLLHALDEPRTTFVGGDAEARKFMRQEGAREPHFDPPAGDGVDHADLARELHRVVEHR